MDDEDKKIDCKAAGRELHEALNKLRELQGEAPLPFFEGPFCSFCGKDKNEVKKLIAGRSVFICDECVVAARKLMNGG